MLAAGCVNYADDIALMWPASTHARHRSQNRGDPPRALPFEEMEHAIIDLFEPITPRDGSQGCQFA